MTINQHLRRISCIIHHSQWHALGSLAVSIRRYLKGNLEYTKEHLLGHYTSLQSNSCTYRRLRVELDTARQHGNSTSLRNDAGVVLGSEHGAATAQGVVHHIGIGFWGANADAEVIKLQLL